MPRRARKGALVVPLAITLVWASAMPAAAAPGDLDRTFRHDGTAITNLTPWNENVRDVAIQANEKIVVVGRASSRSGHGSFAVVRYRADGRLDRGFGGDGVVVTDVAKGEDSASAVAIQPNGKIVVVGTATVARRDTITLVRYRRKGALDRTFGEDGIATVDADDATGEDVAIQPDGRIVVVGTVFGTSWFAVARLDRLGGPDDTFHGDGIATVDADDATGEDVAIQPDGRIVVVGTVFGTSWFAVARLDRLGALDDTFHGDGIATVDVGAERAVTSALALQPDGKIVVAGASWTEAGFDGIAVARFLAGGQVDGSFGTGGVATAEFTAGTDGGGDWAGGVAIQRNGRIVVAGDAGGPAEYTSSFGVARFLGDGSLDPSFRGDGTARTNFTKWDDSASDVAIQADGKIVAAGVAGFAWGSLPTFALARYRVDGTLDPSFGDGGKLRTRVGGVQPDQQLDIVGSWASAVALQSDGRIVVAGDVDRVAADRIDGRFAVARYRTR